MISIRDATAFESGQGPCYVIIKTGASYTREDFLRVSGGDITLAKELFKACKATQTPEEVLQQLKGGVYDDRRTF